VKRGEVWTVAGGADYAGKPRPAIILQSDKFDATLSITICPLTSTLVDAEPARFAIAPSTANGLQRMSHAMVDKISTVPKRSVDLRIGRLEPHHILRLNQHVAIFLGLTE
jgi:mRNA interferase MazF